LLERESVGGNLDLECRAIASGPAIGRGRAQDEIEHLSKPPVDNTTYKADSISSWRGVSVVHFPGLSYVPIDVLTIPPSSAETERASSSCRRMIMPIKSRLRRHVVAKAQCLRSRSKAEIYQPDMPLNLLERDYRRQILQPVGRIRDERDNED
jgi:hypothetical protein